MNIKQKLTWAFAIIACLPVVLVATLVVLNLRGDAKDDFVDGSGREIRQVANAMQLFFDGISQNVEYLANQPLVKNADAGVKSRVSADAAQIPDTEIDTKLFELFSALAASHPAYAYVSYGLSSGGYAFWPGDAKMANYDPRIRPWYKTAMANPGKTVRTEAYYWAGDDAVLVSTVRAVANQLMRVRQALGDSAGAVEIGQTLEEGDLLDYLPFSALLH